MNAVVAARQYFGFVAEALQSVEAWNVERAVGRIQQCREEGGVVWLVGNGGSAATASHFANDLWKMGHVRALSLPDLGPVITAFGNDEGWGFMYKAAMRDMVRPSDVLVAITCSGASRNVLHACGLVAASQLIVLTGQAGPRNEAARFPCYAKFCIPGEIRVVEDVHLAICHCIAGLVGEGAC